MSTTEALTARDLPDPLPLPDLRAGIYRHPQLGELYDTLQVQQRMVAYADASVRAALAAAAASLAAEPAAWRYLLVFGDEFSREVVSRDRFDLTVTSPFGRKGIDFGASGEVEEQPLYAAPGAHSAPAARPETWQPIETAPKERELLLFRADAGIFTGILTSFSSFATQGECDACDEDTLFSEGWFYGDYRGCGRLEGSELPTHWMELPLVPVWPLDAPMLNGLTASETAETASVAGLSLTDEQIDARKAVRYTANQMRDYARDALAAAAPSPAGEPATGDVWLKHDDDLRFVNRVLSAGRSMTDADQAAAKQIVHDLRTTARAQPAPSEPPTATAAKTIFAELGCDDVRVRRNGNGIQFEALVPGAKIGTLIHPMGAWAGLLQDEPDICGTCDGRGCPTCRGPAEGEVPAALPHPGLPEVSAALDAVLAEYNHPANPKNAARAGWTAATRWLAAAPNPPAARNAELTDEQIDALDTFALHALAPRGKESVREFARALLATASSADARDAARYRWLVREACTGSIGFGGDGGWIDADDRDHWSEWIDEAIAAEKGCKA